MIKRSKSHTKRRIVVNTSGCPFCKEGTEPSWQKADTLRKFVSERGKILQALRTGLCPKHQRRLAFAVKRARFIALLPFVVGVK
ncbi:MAG: 30S ribosomal protein S18 [bacterium]|nr:30S ribosomal protein S18 [bacterium]